MISGRVRAALGAGTAVLLGVGLLPTLHMVSPAGAAAAATPVDDAFTLNASDLRFILRQIMIAERHAATATADNPCGTLVGTHPDQIPTGPNAHELPWGLRTVDGSCNNLLPGRERWGAADETFPRLVPPALRDAERGDPDGPGPAPESDTTYDSESGIVLDGGPRRVSNLVVDQTANNPAAVAAAGTSTAPSGDDGTLPIPNVATDAGLSAPYSSLLTLFGQFFDHGLDLVTKGGSGTVFMPLDEDDPLYEEGSPTNFMVLTRTTNQPGPDGKLGTPDDVHEATNTTTAYVDQNQTYTSHPSHQVFLREFVYRGGEPQETGRLLTGADGGMATWSRVKEQARDLLGIELRDRDVLDVPLLATDPYGNFLRGPHGFPQVVTTAGDLVEGDPTADPDEDGVAEGIRLDSGDRKAVRTGHAFLADIAHHANPVGDPDGHGPAPAGPLAPDGDAGTTDDGDPATYDDEMLGRHYIAGDGRVNENIGLTAIHHVFHSEHNRLVEQVKDVLLTEDPEMVDEWQVAPGVWDGDRLFQAARFVDEMEYQHFAFEEFARRVQPMVNPFGEGGGGYHADVDASIRAEFAHAVYRFGHSMLTETVARKTVDGQRLDMPLMDAFLNPPAFTDGGAAGTLSPDAAAGAVIRGMARQTGNEIDEFVTEALRNNLLGLPLDLAAVNIARARETGVPTLNEARRAFYAETGNAALAPYESWADLRFSLKHPETLVNLIAAYGTHPSITSKTTVAGRRAAAEKLVNGPLGEQPADAFDFINGTGEWATPEGGRPTTGLEDVDLWVGGLAEKRMFFGGLLGSTFNYVFERQMEDLQDGDRFYYLARTAGLNLLTQLEGSTFADLVMRNTDVRGLPAAAFSRPDLVFDVTTGPSVVDDPDTSVNESSLVVRTPQGLRYGGDRHVVFNGTEGADRLWSGDGDDTIRGKGGADWLEGGDGDDTIIGGEGDDLLRDLGGDDVIRGGPGDDAISTGQGFGLDIAHGGAGQDFIIGGADSTETFAGSGNDFVMAGDGIDAVLGDSGDDWLEGGRGAVNTLEGDNGAPFQDDLNTPGNDVLIGTGGRQNYLGEGGDDIMLAGAGIQRSNGMFGFDWFTQQGDTQPGDADLNISVLLPPSVEEFRDRFIETEAVSGSVLDDVIRGDDRTMVELLGADELSVGSHELTPDGVARIDGLAELFPDRLRPEEGPDADRVFASGNILIGGGGSDVLEGRGGDDLIDGDAALTVAVHARYRDGTERTVTQLADLRQDVLDGRLDPGELTIVRRIVDEGDPDDVDTAVFSGRAEEYAVTTHADGTTTVTHLGGLDGTDTLRNIEKLVFADTPPTGDVPAAPTITGVTVGARSAKVSFTTRDDGGSSITGLEVWVYEGSATTPTFVLGGIDASATSATVTELTPGTPYSFKVVARNEIGVSPPSSPYGPVTPTGATSTPTSPPPSSTPPPVVSPPPVAPPPVTAPPPAVVAPPAARVEAPDAPRIRKATSGRRGGKRTAVARWWAPKDDGGTGITGYRVVAHRLGKHGKVRWSARSHWLAPNKRRYTMTLPKGSYRFTVIAVNDVGRSEESPRSNRVRSR